ncbi:MAG: glycosyltransferase family 39 protein [Patescibacteria group bacterium]|nr:glycosyltransferase family 39 protein [Patescibacteria group bacterium]
MKKTIEAIKGNWILIVIVLVGFILRFYKVGEIPPGVSHDELDYINNGYSILKTGRDLYGNFLPLTVGGVGNVAIPAYIVAIPMFFLGLSEWSVRLVPVVLGTIEILLIFGIAKTFFKSREVALWSAFILALSNWGIKISRVMFDPPVSLFFFLLGIYLFLTAKTKKRFLFAWIVLALGLLSYQGAIFFFPFVILALVFYRLDFIKSNKQILLMGGAALLVSGFILFQMLFHNANNSRASARASELIFSDTQKISAEVIFARFNSSDSSVLNNIFVNKATYVFQQFLTNYIGAFSPVMIFVSGDPSAIYGLWGRGELAILDLPLILAGLYLVYQKHKREAFLITSMILIAPITSGISGQVYATRAFLMWPFLIILGGVGLNYFIQITTNFKPLIEKLLIILFFGVYLFTFASLEHQYYFRYPVYAREIWFDSEKQLSYYLMNHQNEKMTVYSKEGKEAFMEYFFFSQMDPQIAQAALDKNNVNADILVGNLRFVNGCINPKEDKLLSGVAISYTCSVDSSTAAETIKTRDKSDRIRWSIFLSND